MRGVASCTMKPRELPTESMTAMPATALVFRKDRPTPDPLRRQDEQPVAIHMGF